MMPGAVLVQEYKRVKAAYPDKVWLNSHWGLQAALLDLPRAATLAEGLPKALDNRYEFYRTVSIRSGRGGGSS